MFWNAMSANSVKTRREIGNFEHEARIDIYSQAFSYSTCTTVFLMLSHTYKVIRIQF